MQVIYMDTEGFEASGKSDAYDDRIFALSTFMSSLLIYNLPETVRESDIEKLSFAVELAEAFYADVQVLYTDAPGGLSTKCDIIIRELHICDAAFVQIYP